MSVLTLAGKPINWHKPPRHNALVIWSRKTTSGRVVKGSLRTIAHLDHLDSLAVKKYGKHIEVMQGPYNTTVARSAGTHDYDACLDVRIPGVDWYEQQRFFRANGAGAYYRSPSQGFTPHIHYFTLPPVAAVSVSERYRRAGYKVGVYVDGGWSTQGRMTASSQILDYYTQRTALSGHAIDPTWFPENKDSTVFNLSAYVVRQRNRTAVPGKNAVANILAHAPLARLGGEAGQDLWERWEATLRKQGNHNRSQGITTTYTLDTNKRDGLPRLGPGLKRLGGVGIDLIAKRQFPRAAKISVLKRRMVNLNIDGHECYGVRLRVKFPNGRTVKYWLVVANIGRKADEARTRRNIERVRKAFGTRAIYNFMEIDEADRAEENVMVRDIFPASDFVRVNKGRLVQTLVGRKIPIKVVDTKTPIASPGMAKVSPPRQMVMTTIAPK